MNLTPTCSAAATPHVAVRHSVVGTILEDTTTALMLSCPSFIGARMRDARVVNLLVTGHFRGRTNWLIMLRKYTARRGEPDSAIAAGSPRLLPSSWDYVPTSLKFTIRTSKCQNHYLNSIGESHLCCRCLYNADTYKIYVWCEGVVSVVSNGLLKSTTTMAPIVLLLLHHIIS